MRFLLFGLVVFAAGGLLGAALIRPQFLEQLLSEVRGLQGRSQGLTDRSPAAPADLPPGDSWGRVLVGSPAIPPVGPGSMQLDPAQDLADAPAGNPGSEHSEQAAGAESGLTFSQADDLEASGYLEPEPANFGAGEGASDEELRQIAPGGELPPILSPDRQAPGYAEFIVRKGDTLTSIAAEHYGRRERALVESLARFNRLTDANGLEIGQRLSLPPLSLLLGE